jgi:4-aminobutyrate aminotransferase
MAPTSSEPLTPEAALALKRRYLVPCSYHFYRDPPVIASGSGCRLTDTAGKTYVDFFSGVAVMSWGQANPAVVEPAIAQIRALQHTTSIYLTEPVLRLAERLAAVLPGGIEQSFFCNSGSEANEGAMLLARLATGKPGFIALSGGLHGRTFLTQGATALPMWRTDPFLDGLPVRVAADADGVLDLVARYGDSIAALIVEPVQGNAGIRPLPADFFARILPALRERGVLLIADEVQTGFGRTGKMFAVEHWGVVPDIITGAKALGGGFPIGFFAAAPSLAAKFTKPSASTLGGNPVSCAAALAVLDLIAAEGLVDRARVSGERLAAVLDAAAAVAPGLGKPRGLGLMRGLPVLASGGRSAPERTDLILENLKDAGFLVGKNGLDRDVLAFQPPLVIGEADIDALGDTLAAAVKAADR